VVEIDKCVLRFNEIELRIFEPDDVGYFHSFEMLPHFIFSQHMPAIRTRRTLASIFYLIYFVVMVQ